MTGVIFHFEVSLTKCLLQVCRGGRFRDWLKRVRHNPMGSRPSSELAQRHDKAFLKINIRYENALPSYLLVASWNRLRYTVRRSNQED